MVGRIFNRTRSETLNQHLSVLALAKLQMKLYLIPTHARGEGSL